MWGKTTANYVNIRSSASTSSTVVYNIPYKGTEITVDTISSVHDWLYVTYGSYSGYISSQYVEVYNGGMECYVNISSGALNIRKTPSSNGTVLYTRHNNDSMMYLGSYNGYKCVSCSKGTGWAKSEYIFVPA